MEQNLECLKLLRVPAVCFESVLVCSLLTFQCLCWTQVYTLGLGPPQPSRTRAHGEIHVSTSGPPRRQTHWKFVKLRESIDSSSKTLEHQWQAHGLGPPDPARNRKHVKPNGSLQLGAPKLQMHEFLHRILKGNGSV